MQSIINFGVLSSRILLTWPHHCSLFCPMMSMMSGFPFTPIISFICTVFGKITYKIRTMSTKNSTLCTIYWYTEMVRTCRLLLLISWRRFSRGGIRPTHSRGLWPIAGLTPCRQHFINRTAVFVPDQGGGREASPSRVRRQFLAESGASKFKGETGTRIKKRFDKIFVQCRTQPI